MPTRSFRVAGVVLSVPPERLKVMFRGINSVNLDAKGRMALPSRHREALPAADGKLVVTIDSRERCLLLYPLAAWEAVQSAT